MPHDPAQSRLPSPEATRRGYESSEVGVRGLLIFLICFALFALLLHAAVWAYQAALLRRVRAADQPLSAVHAAQPPPPGLQPSIGHDSLPYQDMQAMRDHENAVFSRLGWQMDPRTRAPAIPEAIIQRVAERMAPARSPTSVPSASTPLGANTFWPGPPATQNVHATGGSPQGPALEKHLDSADQPVLQMTPGPASRPRPERPQP